MDLIAEEQNADTPNNVAGLGPDSDDLEDVLIHKFADHSYSSESNISTEVTGSRTSWVTHVRWSSRGAKAGTSTLNFITG